MAIGQLVNSLTSLQNTKCGISTAMMFLDSVELRDMRRFISCSRIVNPPLPGLNRHIGY